MRYAHFSVIASALVLAVAGEEREAVPKTEAPKREIDPWIGTTGKAESPRFTRNPATKVAWVREVAVSTMVGCEMVLKEKGCAPFERVEDGRDPYYRVKGDSLLLRKVLGGAPETPPEGAKLFLVRAVYLHPLTGSFTAYLQDGDLLVRDITDPIRLLGWLYLGSEPPASPRDCGPDPDGTLLDCRESGCP